MNTNIIQLPEILLDGFMGIDELDGRFLYGLKNPESFTKALLLLTRSDFIIKGKFYYNIRLMLYYQIQINVHHMIDLVRKLYTYIKWDEIVSRID